MSRTIHDRSTVRIPNGRSNVTSWVPTSIAPGAFRQITAAYSLQTYALSEVLKDSPLPIEDAVSFGEPCHYRMWLPGEFATGSAEFCGLSDGFFVSVNDIHFPQPIACAISMPDMLRIRVSLDGDGGYLPSDEDVLDIRGATAGLIIEPPNMPPAECISTGHHLVAHIMVHRETLQRLYPQSEQLPALIAAFLANQLTHRVARQLTCGPALLRCLEDLQGCSLTGRNRWLFFRSKAVEILCHAFEALKEQDSIRSIGLAEPSAMIERAILKAKNLLMEQFVTPPSLDDLAREVGLSRTGLCANFVRMTGGTVFDFVTDLRMQHALAMLNRRDISITEIAYAVGYNYPSSFSVAVHRRFGMSPRELRGRRSIS